MRLSVLQPLFRVAAIKAIDGISDRVVHAEEEAESAIARLVLHWKRMDRAQKERVVEVAIAAAGAAAAAFAAYNRARNTKGRTAKAKRKRISDD